MLIDRSCWQGARTVPSPQAGPESASLPGAETPKERSSRRSPAILPPSPNLQKRSGPRLYDTRCTCRQLYELFNVMVHACPEVDTSRFYDLLGVTKDATPAEIKKVPTMGAILGTLSSSWVVPWYNTSQSCGLGQWLIRYTIRSSGGCSLFHLQNLARIHCLKLTKAFAARPITSKPCVCIQTKVVILMISKSYSVPLRYDRDSMGGSWR